MLHCNFSLVARPVNMMASWRMHKISYEKFDLCIQDLEGGQESLFSHLIETSLHYLTSSTTSPPIYAGSTFLNCVVISYFKIIYFWIFIKKNNSLIEFFFSFWVYWFPRRHGTCTAMFTCLLDFEHAWSWGQASIQAWIWLKH